MKDKDIRIAVMQVLVDEYKVMLKEKDYSFLGSDSLLSEIARIELIIKYSDNIIEEDDVKQIEVE